MAEILLARVKDSSPERLVVLKRMHRQLAADREFVQMFMDEARLAEGLRHPNVVEVYEFGEDNDQYYIAMEYLHGHDLRRVLSEMASKGMSIRLSHALGIITGVCRGLEYTHQRANDAGEPLGIVHRDVSPHNVLLTYTGKVKLVDFGIAKMANHASRTRTGILKGKVAYMSPEQAMGDALDRRSDIFCIGILLWEMTTGQWLYRRKSELETLKAVVESDAPLPSQVHAGYPRELEQIVMKALARKRDERWSTAGELADALAEFSTKRRIKPSPAMLGTMMTSVFSDEVAAWQDARRAGSSLGDHMVAERMREEREAEIAHRAKFGPPPGPTGRPADPDPSIDDGAPSEISDVVTNGISLHQPSQRDLDDFDSPNADHTIDETLDWDPRTSELEELPTTVQRAVRKPTEPELIARARTRSQSFGVGRSGAAGSSGALEASRAQSAPWSSPRTWWLAGSVLVLVAALWLVLSALH
jgi:serine/threonine protein kinase